MEKPNEPTRKLTDRKTGREVITAPPYRGFQWRDGFVLRRLTSKEGADLTRDRGEGAIVGNDPFEWVPADEVDIAD